MTTIYTENITGQVGIKPRFTRMLTDATLSDLTAAGFLNPLIKQGYTFEATDVILVSYANNASGLFSPVITGTTGTLTPNLTPGEVILPVVNGNVAQFNGTNGAISDTGIASNRLTYSYAGVVTPQPVATLLTVEATVGFAALAGAGLAMIWTAPGIGAETFAIHSILADGGTDFAGGDRNLNIFIGGGAPDLADIAAADLQALTNAHYVWGSAEMPFPTATPLRNPITAAQQIAATYTGGTTDYTSGELKLYLTIEQLS